MSEYIVFVSKEHYNPLGIVRTLGEAGIYPIVVAVKGELKFVGQSKYVKKKYYVDTPEDGLNLIISKFSTSKIEKSFILTGDDVVVALMDKNYDKLKDYFYFYNAGEANRINYYMNKDNMLELVSRHGINVAKTWKIKVGEIPKNIEYPIMTKAINSIEKEWKDIVYICNNAEELKKVCEKIKSEYILVQRYINKIDEVSFDSFSINQGKDVFMVMEAHQEYCIYDKYSPVWKIKNSENKKVTEKIKSIIAEIGLEGIFEFEFMIDNQGQLWFLEINFRNTALGYATTIAGMPQVILWCEAMEQGKIASDWYKKIPNGMKAIAECFDYDVRVKTGKMSRKAWMKEYKRIPCKMYKGRYDNIPFYRFLWYKYTKMKR